MAEHRKPEEDIKDYYKLNTDAVDRLVNAQKETAKPIPEEEKQFTKPRFLDKVPCFVKALFIKFWFNGACCFFFYWGLGMFVRDVFALILILGIASGIVTDLITNNLFRFMQTSEREYDKWMLLPMKKYRTFFVNIVYALMLVVFVVYTYNGINRLIVSSENLPSDTVVLGVEPILYGLIYLLYDLVFIGIKNLAVKLVKKKKYAAYKD